MGDYGKDAPSGGGIRLRVLYDAIVNRSNRSGEWWQSTHHDI